MSEIIEFMKTPNVSKILDFEDYLEATQSEETPFMGFIKVIHCNEKYPQFQNIRIGQNDEVSIYTEKGWEIVDMKKVTIKLQKEVSECLEYMRDNSKEFIKIAGDIDKLMEQHINRKL